MKQKKAVRKNLLRTIKASLTRYLAIVGIIALGSAIFVGLASTKADMVETGSRYMQRQNMFDLRLISTYGWTQEDVDAVSQMAGVSMAEGQISLDAIGQVGHGIDGSVYKLYSLPDGINRIRLISGRMPENPNECLVDGHHATDDVLGTTFTVAVTNPDSVLDSLEYHSFTVVGYVSTPLYMDMSRGSTNLGSGIVAGFVYLPREAFDMEVYTEIVLCFTQEARVYSEEYDAVLSQMADALQPQVQLLADGRLAGLLAEAEAAYQTGLNEYNTGLDEYETARSDALQLLADGLQQLQDAQIELDSNRTALEEGLQQLQQAQQLLDQQRDTLDAGRLELAQGRQEAYTAFAAAYDELLKNYQNVRDAQAQVRDGLRQIDDGLAQLDNGIAQLSDGLAQLDDGLQQLELAISMEQTKIKALERLLSSSEAVGQMDPELIASLREELEASRQNLEDYLLQKAELTAMHADYSAQLQQLQTQRQEVLDQRQELVQTQRTLEDAMAAIEDGFVELDTTRQQTESQFAAAQSQLDAGQLQLDQAQAELDQKRAEALLAQQQLDDGQLELDEAFAEYEIQKSRAEQELADARQKLDEAQQTLADARYTIDTMAPAEVFLLDRNMNAGYMALDNNSDIVAGVSRVFPAFFLLIAAMVCITTMTRMVVEERTQIGTMKALGYNNRTIISKYLLYAGSAAILGCGLGTLLGSIIFPSILWEVYKIIIFVPEDVVLLINWPLCIAVVASYTVVVLLVTWYCCRRSLREVPAELIRPKAPADGKKIWLEHLRLWRRFSFLNKLMLRNVFRYRQRMFMMLLGIGGCTALLLTGFGLRDSVKGLIPQQFGEVTVYDIQIYFSEGQSQQSQESFRQELQQQGMAVHFYYQTGIELHHEGQTKELNLLVSDPGIRDYVHLTWEGEDLGTPQENEVYLSVGIAQQMGISVGDKVTLRSAHLQTLELTVAAIYYNSVYNYAFVSPQTLQAQWQQVPLPQMAMVKVPQNLDHSKTGAEIANMDGVINVNVTKDLIELLDGILSALDMIVIVVVICAGALAVIVLYNLTNINITERLREIATIKVLGFRAWETAAYVYKENLLLSFMGMICGIPFGYWLLKFVVSQIKVDMVWLTPALSIRSCLISAVLTILSAFVVNGILYRKLEQINMAEALKSVE